jgi:hypothetical protein
MKVIFPLHPVSLLLVLLLRLLRLCCPAFNDLNFVLKNRIPVSRDPYQTKK